MSEIKTRWEEIPVEGEKEKMPVYIAEPAQSGAHPVIFVFQEIFGVNPHIRDVTERIAKEGYTCFAPDAFYRSGKHFESGYADFGPGFERAQKVTNESFLKDMKSLHRYVESYPAANVGKLGATGFCMGGRLTFLLSASMPLRAGVSFYGGGIAQNLLDRAPAVNAPLLFFFGGLDKHIPLSDVGKIEESLKSAGKKAEFVVYEKADHGFFCDARASYNTDAAKDAWSKTKAFFAKHLKD